MPNPQLVYSAADASSHRAFVKFATLNALDALGAPQAFTATVSIDDYVTAFVNVIVNVPYLVVKSWPGTGITKTVNVTFAAKDVNGNALPAVILPFDIVGPPVPPLATHLQVPVSASLQYDTSVAIPADPGSASVVV